ncbi:MAG: BACON domain-containing protein, partial [Bacteroidales bacterium]|nr:BACON domain-containing protein [Bacteroidales bacterium]
MKKLFYLFSLTLLLVSCVQQKEVIKEPSVLKIVPEASMGESWRAHDIKIMVVCDLDADVELVDTPWASVTGSEITGNGQTTVTIRVEANDGEQPRKGLFV